jgi:hypothetical protein
MRLFEWPDGLASQISCRNGTLYMSKTRGLVRIFTTLMAHERIYPQSPQFIY